ncbi:MAG: hypothetical protein LBG27_08600 [Spirochaetaceae bacterium]|jgi:hypothetical protein|nr:hypothetical protein [Spirochaetaceae bacterium]
MKMHRQLQQNVWYKVGTEVNIGEPLFKLPMAVVLLHRVLREDDQHEDDGTYGADFSVVSCPC